MSDRKLMVTVFTLLTGAIAYHFAVTPTTAVQPKLASFPTSTAYGPSLAVVDCQDCLEVVEDSCEIQNDECSESASCEMWMQCTQDCIALGEDQECFDDCDVAHSDSHVQCSSMKSCMCDVCIGQCVDMCRADG